MVTKVCRGITSARRGITSAAKSIAFTFSAEKCLLFNFYFLISRNFFVRHLTKVTWYSLIPVFMRLHASDLSLRYLTYTSLTGHLEVTSSMYKMLSLLFWLSSILLFISSFG